LGEGSWDWCESKKATSRWPIAATQSHDSEPRKASQCETPHPTLNPPNEHQFCSTA